MLLKQIASTLMSNKALKVILLLLTTGTTACLLYLGTKNVDQLDGIGSTSSTKVQSLSGWKTIEIYIGPEQNIKDSGIDWESNSQVGQDTVVNAIFPEGGFFIDLAANDWKDISNTYSLEVYAGWTGVCVEANDIYTKGHKRRKSTLVSAVVGSRRDEKVSFFDGNGAFGGIVADGMDNAGKNGRTDMTEHYTVSVVDIFEKTSVPGTVHYFSLDVEGAESMVFSQMPFVAHDIYLFTIERPPEDVRDILKREKYVEVGILGWFGDIMYMSSKTPDFMKRLRLGQLAISTLTKKVNSADNSDIGPVESKKGFATGVRCPYTQLSQCGSDLLPWDTVLLDLTTHS